MSVFERLLKSESTEPACQCGGKMAIERIELIPDTDARVSVYQCQYCLSELRLPDSATTDVGITRNHDTGPSRNEDRRVWAEYHRREVAEDRKFGQIILGSLAALALICGLIVMFSGNTSNVANHSEPVATGSTGTAPANTPTR